MSTPPHEWHHHSRGFTLIELIVALSVIVILAALAFPMLKSGMVSAKQAAGVSNLRQVVAAARTIVQENNGSWWWSYYPSQELRQGGPSIWWGQAVSNVLEGRGTFDSQGPLSAALRDPLAPPGSANNFAPLAVLFGNVSANMGYGRSSAYRVAFSQRPASQVFIADCRGGWDNIQGVGIGGSIWNWGWSGPSESMGNWTHDKLTGYGSSAGQIDFARGNGKAKVAFLDGHVELVTPAQLTHRMVDPAFP